MIDTNIDIERLPKHVALIMDGNRTWAKQNGLEPIEGHKQLVVSLNKIIKYAYNLGIDEVTFYAFSTENWKRSEYEVNYLMELYNDFIKDFHLNYTNIKFRLIGNIDRLPTFLQESIINTEKNNSENCKMIFNMAINYGGREEITNSVKNIIEDINDKKVNIEDITEDVFEKYLYTKGDSNPDLLIRTSGQIRLSNFLLWQLSYAELYFTNVYWPDFNEEEFDKAIIEYQNRTRKFGGN